MNSRRFPPPWSVEDIDLDQTTGLALETISELAFFGLVPLLLIVGTVWILWHVHEKINPDDVTDIRSFLTFILVIVPFVSSTYFGLAIILYDAINAGSGWPTILPLSELSPVLLGFAAFNIGLTVWLWLQWHKLRISQRPIER